MANGFLSLNLPSILKQAPTLFFRSIILIVLELLSNALLWVVTVIVFKQSQNSGKLLSLALVAWTLGLRHGLDADHISAIDNATRRIASIPQTSSNGQTRLRKPVTVGLFFSLGHSTIVIAVVMAVAISTLVASKLDGVSGIGGTIGSAISGSFLILVAIINSFILGKTWKRIQREKKIESRRMDGETNSLQPQQANSESRHRNNNQDTEDEIKTETKEEDLETGKESKEKSQSQGQISSEPHRFSGLLTRIALPLLKLVSRPWHMYPVGVLFGFGFDTASSITLLSIAIVATRNQTTEDSVQSSDQSAPQVILLALLFTAGMSLVDSLDSVMMIYAYAFNFPDKEKGEKWWDLFEKKEDVGTRVNEAEEEENKVESKENPEVLFENVNNLEQQVNVNNKESSKPKLLLSSSTFSSLSLLLTLLSILLAMAIGVIVLMGLIGDSCERCSRAADKQEESGNGGLEGRFWLAWRNANDQSGLVGAGIVGTFALILVGYVTFKVGRKRLRARRQRRLEGVSE